jgi:hypothetical protein
MPCHLLCRTVAVHPVGSAYHVLHAGATNASLATAATTTAAALITAAGIPVHNTTIFTPTNDAFTSLGLDIPAADFFNATLNSTSFNVGTTTK